MTLRLLLLVLPSYQPPHLFVAVECEVMSTRCSSIAARIDLKRVRKGSFSNVACPTLLSPLLFSKKSEHDF